MKRISSLFLGALAMIAVALISAFIAMRLAIHGREAVVPPLTGLTMAEADEAARHQGLHLTLENRFYAADTPAGQILAQDPAPGSRVRREWPVRITESLGSQAVSIPDLTGESERVATLSIRRHALDLGVVAHLPIAGDADVVITQTPAANGGGIDGPRVSLLVSDPENAGPQAYVMPSVVGLSYAAAVARAATVGVHLIAAAEPSPSVPVPASIDGGTNAAPANAVAAPAPNPTSGVVVAQYPQAGRRVQQGDAVHITLAHPAAAAPVPHS